MILNEYFVNIVKFDCAHYDAWIILKVMLTDTFQGQYVVTLLMDYADSKMKLLDDMACNTSF